ncbi:uncharacterized protein ELE39_002190 [Cryptosporidium sp. chipmunk genotype I]|uniref:uncharacterized protein n=1 Tax=Cryptosporidium sp. chipmunk genotype I TaxID=1280935 RepID=UPI00351A6A73|nr:hypothetical protein ELE39_002190 [Cryptosporidium sp. chipmunk genotype I]
MRIFILLSFLSLVGCVIRKGGGNQTVSLNSNSIDNNFDVVKNGYFVDPAKFNICADTSNLEEVKKIPRLSNTELYNTMNLIQLQVIARHGARTPVKSCKCWEGYQQNWDCSNLKTLIHTSALEMESKTRTLKFSKHYEAKLWENSLSKTCKMGQLTSQGYEQHRINGKLLAKAYFKGESLVTKSGLEMDNYVDEMYIRSSDTQRTTVSAAALVTSLLEEIFGKEKTFQTFRNIPIFTMDIQSEYLFANKNLVDNSQVLKQVFSSKEFRELIESRESLHMELDQNAKVSDINSSWPFDFLDCISMAVCSGDDNQLPEAFFKNNLLERTMSAIEKEVSTVFSWNNSIIAKGDISRFMFEIRDFILDAILLNEKKNDEFSNIKKLCSNTGRSQVFKSQDSLANSEYLLTPLCNKYEQYSSLNEEINIKAPKFILFSGHDLTVIPLLSSLHLWDERLPPYASTVNIEIYHNPSKKQENHGDSNSFSKVESIQKILPYYTRLLYNGLVVTDKLMGCKGNEVCHVSFFFNLMKAIFIDLT